MRINKCLTSIILCFIMLFSSFQCVLAAEDSYETEILTLSGLGLIQDYSPETYTTKVGVTWKEYLTAVLKLRLDEIPNDDIMGTAIQYGLISDADNINLTKPILFDDAIRISVKILGYDVLNKKSNQSYYSIASEYKIIKNVVKSDDKLNSDQFLRIIYNMLEVKLMLFDYSNSFFVGDETALSEYRNIKKSSGLMHFNEYTSIYGNNGGQTNSIGIGNNEYYIDNKEYNKYLGMNVDYYYDEENETAICVVPSKKNSELIISSDDFVGISDRFDYIRYTVNSGSREKKANLNQIKVIYNGRCVTGYDNTIFDVAEGNYRLIDNNNDSKYDVIFITSYNLVKVNSVDYAKQYITNEYDNLPNTLFPGKKLDFSELIFGENLFVYKDGKSVAFTEIKYNDILLLEYSLLGDEMLVKLYINNSTFTGTVNRIDADENEIVIDSAEYKINKEFLKLVSAFNMYAQMPKLSYEYTFYLDATGKIAGCMLMENSNENYVLLYRVSKVYDNEDVVTIRYVDTNNEHKTSNLALRTNIDGQRYVGSDEQYLKLQEFHGTIIKVSYDTEGNIRKIITPTLRTATTGPDEFNYEPKQSLEYRASGKGSVTFGGKYYIEEDTKAFVIFDISSNRKEDYACVPFSQQHFKGSESGNMIDITPYNVDRFGVAGIIVKEAKANEGENTLSMVVSSSPHQELDDDEVVSTLSGCVGNFINFKVKTKDDTLFSGVTVGDYIEVTVDSKGYAKSITTIYSSSEGTKYDYPDSLKRSFYSSVGTYMGTLKDIDVGRKKMKVYFGADGEKNFDMSRLEPPVYICEGRNVRISDVSEIDIEDMMIVSVSRDVPQRIVVYKK